MQLQLLSFSGLVSHGLGHGIKFLSGSLPVFLNKQRKGGSGLFTHWAVRLGIYAVVGLRRGNCGTYAAVFDMAVLGPKFQKMGCRSLCSFFFQIT